MTLIDALSPVFEDLSHSYEHTFRGSTRHQRRPNKKKHPTSGISSQDELSEVWEKQARITSILNAMIKQFISLIGVYGKHQVLDENGSMVAHVETLQNEMVKKVAELSKFHDQITGKIRPKFIEEDKRMASALEELIRITKSNVTTLEKLRYTVRLSDSLHDDYSEEVFSSGKDLRAALLSE